jgi:hypothetical protein
MRVSQRCNLRWSDSSRASIQDGCERSGQVASRGQVRVPAVKTARYRLQVRLEHKQQTQGAALIFANSHFTPSSPVQSAAPSSRSDTRIIHLRFTFCASFTKSMCADRVDLGNMMDTRALAGRDVGLLAVQGETTPFVQGRSPGSRRGAGGPWTR